MKYSYEQRLIIVSRVKQGEAISHLSKEYHINETQILAWVRIWDKYGRSGLEQQPHCRPTVQLKEEIVRNNKIKRECEVKSKFDILFEQYYERLVLFAERRGGFANDRGYGPRCLFGAFFPEGF